MLSANAAPTIAPAAALLVRVASASREEPLSLCAAPPLSLAAVPKVLIGTKNLLLCIYPLLYQLCCMHGMRESVMNRLLCSRTVYLAVSRCFLYSHTTYFAVIPLTLHVQRI